MGIRITGGTLRGRIIDSPLSPLTRPTGAMTREAVFNILQDVSGFKVLDLFAGSGIMGIEALSRGADFVVAVEKNHAQALAIKKTYQKLGLENKLLLLEQDALNFKSIASAILHVAHSHFENSDDSIKFDLIYADPPFKETYPDLRACASLLDERGVAVFECPSRALPEWTSPLRVRRYGESSLAFLESNHGENP